MIVSGLLVSRDIRVVLIAIVIGVVAPWMPAFWSPFWGLNRPGNHDAANCDFSRGVADWLQRADRTGPQPDERHALNVEWRIVERAELKRAYRSAGMWLDNRDDLRGFAGYLPDGTAVVYTLPPQRVDDDAVCTLGHEIMHITYGDYHR